MIAIGHGLSLFVTLLFWSHLCHDLPCSIFQSLLVFSKLFSTISICAEIVDFTKNVLKYFNIFSNNYYYLALICKQSFGDELVGARGISNVLAAASNFHIFYLVLFYEKAALPMLFSSTMHARFKQS